MLEHAVYSVISPEGCASILWRTADKAPQAAEAMRLTAQSLAELGIIDRIVPEPVGGAQRNPQEAAEALAEALSSALGELDDIAPDALRTAREERYLAIGRQL